MNRRTALMLTGMTLLGLAIAALPQVGFAQSSPLIGTWKQNLDKSKYRSGPPPESNTLTYQQEGQNIRLTQQGINAEGNSVAIVYIHFYDGQPHPTTASRNYDASAYTRVDANTVIFTRLKAGKLVAIGTSVVSQDGKTLTVTTTGDNGRRAGTDMFVYEKQ